jgi:hypothetical protein
MNVVVCKEYRMITLSIAFSNIIILATYRKFRLALIAVPFLTKMLKISLTSLKLTLKAQGNTITLGQPR